MLEDDRLPLHRRFGFGEPEARYPDPLPSWMIEDDRLTVESRRFGFVKLEMEYPNPPCEALDVDVASGADVTPGWMLEDERLPVNSRRFTPGTSEDAPGADPGVDVAPGWMLEDDRLPVSNRRFGFVMRNPNPP